MKKSVGTLYIGDEFYSNGIKYIFEYWSDKTGNVVARNTVSNKQASFLVEEQVEVVSDLESA